MALRQGVAQELPYPDASFDSVVSTFPTDYIFDPATTREMARVLRVGGRLLVVLGARLLPAHLLVVPLVAMQTLVYGSQGRSMPNAPTPPGGDGVGSLGPEREGDLLLGKAAGSRTHGSGGGGARSVLDRHRVCCREKSVRNLSHLRLLCELQCVKRQSSVEPEPFAARRRRS